MGRLGQIVLLFLSAASSCADSRAPALQKERVPVTTERARVENVPVQVDGIGRAVAVASVTVMPQVDGIVERAHVREGRAVRRGEPLFSLDRRPLAAALAEARGRLAQDELEAAEAIIKGKRWTQLAQAGFASRELADELVAHGRALEAAASASRAAVESARLRLEHASIRAPIGGRAGAVLVDAGNVVRANETKLVSIRTVSPIHVDVSVPVVHLARIRSRLDSGVRVDARPAADGAAGARGVLTFVDNAVDEATGTILVRATFENADEAMWPGDLLEVVLTLDEPPGVVVPARAVVEGPQGSFVFVVHEDGSAEERRVLVDRTVGERAVIARGVGSGDEVVTDGQLRLVPGSLVRRVPERGDS
ncbi:MAG: efflux RND transporter periplasmic adaptor subunit [Deltaproteobacteria bacterium]|nr:efflux RND transporter periplasmic adaptor subunit [Deltaproteobacteria bacterium]